MAGSCPGQLSAEVKRFPRFATRAERSADQARSIAEDPARPSLGRRLAIRAATRIGMQPHVLTTSANLEPGVS